MTDALVEPTSVTIEPGFNAGAISLATAPEAPTIESPAEPYTNESGVDLTIFDVSAPEAPEQVGQMYFGDPGPPRQHRLRVDVL